jgi:hypothetical protein
MLPGAIACHSTGASGRETKRSRPELEQPMVRYFFHVMDGKDIIDDVGTELADIEAVRGMALRTSGEILRDGGPEFWNSEPWKMIVRDEDGRKVLTLQFEAQQH